MSRAECGFRGGLGMSHGGCRIEGLGRTTWIVCRVCAGRTLVEEEGVDLERSRTQVVVGEER